MNRSLRSFGVEYRGAVPAGAGRRLKTGGYPPGVQPVKVKVGIPFAQRVNFCIKLSKCAVAPQTQGLAPQGEFCAQRSVALPSGGAHGVDGDRLVLALDAHAIQFLPDVAGVGGAFKRKTTPGISGGTSGSSTTSTASGSLWDYEKRAPLPQRTQRPNIEVNQYIYSKAQTAADLMREAQYEQERAVLQGV